MTGSEVPNEVQLVYVIEQLSVECSEEQWVVGSKRVTEAIELLEEIESESHSLSPDIIEETKDSLVHIKHLVEDSPARGVDEMAVQEVADTISNEIEYENY